MNIELKVVEIFYFADNFCKEFNSIISKSRIAEANGIQLITGIKRNMKNFLMTIFDKILLRKRAVIETVNDELKNICQVEHSRHRSFSNFLSNMISGLVAYSFFPKKTAIKYETEEVFGLLALF